MNQRTPTRVRVEVVLAIASFVLALVTLVWRDWIEFVFRVDPDHGNGSAEWVVVGGLVVFAAVAFAVSRWELRRLAASPSS